MQALNGLRTRHEAAADPRRNHVGGLAALADHAVDLIAGWQLLAQQTQRDLGDRHGIERIDALPGGGRGMGFPAHEMHIEMRDGQAGAGQPFDRPGVDHHGGVDAVEGAPVEHQDLAPATFFGRRAQYPHGQPDRVSHGRQG